MKIQARFTATPINAFAPAIVHLDASATTVDGPGRPFHDLQFAWYVVYEGETIPLEVPESPMSAVVLDRPGRWAIILRAQAPDGSSAHAFQRLTLAPAPRVLELEPGRLTSFTLPAGPGLLRSRDASNPATILNTLTVPDGWTLQHVHFEGGGAMLRPGASNIAFLDVEMREVRNGGVVSMTGDSTPRHSDLIGLARTTIRGASDSRMPDVFLRAERIVILDSVLNGGGTYNLRTVHFPRMVLARSRVESLTAGANALQLRGWGGSGPPNTPSHYWAVIECELSVQSPGAAIVRTCQTNTCDDTGPGVWTAADIQHGIFRRNYLQVGGAGTLPPAIGFWLQGGDITIEDNELDGAGAPMTGPGMVRFVQQRPDSTRRTGLTHDRIQVRRNRIRLRSGTRAVTALEAPAGVGHVSDDNEIVRT